MASMRRFSYQRLRHEIAFDDEEDDRDHALDLQQLQYHAGLFGRSRSWARLNLKRIHVRRRLKVRVPGLKRFIKRKARLVRTTWSKVVKRLKESQAHFGELFAGNYLFLQVNPGSLKKLSAGKDTVVGYHHHNNLNFAAAAGFSGLRYYNNYVV